MRSSFSTYILLAALNTLTLALFRLLSNVELIDYSPIRGYFIYYLLSTVKKHWIANLCYLWRVNRTAILLYDLVPTTRVLVVVEPKKELSHKVDIVRFGWTTIKVFQFVSLSLCRGLLIIWRREKRFEYNLARELQWNFEIEGVLQKYDIKITKNTIMSGIQHIQQRPFNKRKLTTSMGKQIPWCYTLVTKITMRKWRAWYRARERRMAIFELTEQANGKKTLRASSVAREVSQASANRESIS